MDAYGYPERPHSRRHGPSGYRSVEAFRPWLRDEFAFRCVYCLDRERWSNIVASFHLDHFLPAVYLPQRSLAYDNLLYTCRSCNALKGQQQIPDPLRELLSSTVVVHRDGRIEARTKGAARLIDLVGLDDPAYRERRKVQLRVLALAEQYDLVLYRMLLGYPSELPNLARLHPRRNSRPQGVAESFYARRRRGALAEIY